MKRMNFGVNDEQALLYSIRPIGIKLRFIDRASAAAHPIRPRVKFQYTMYKM